MSDEARFRMGLRQLRETVCAQLIALADSERSDNENVAKAEHKLIIELNRYRQQIVDQIKASFERDSTSATAEEMAEFDRDYRAAELNGFKFRVMEL